MPVAGSGLWREPATSPWFALSGSAVGVEDRYCHGNLLVAPGIHKVSVRSARGVMKNRGPLFTLLAVAVFGFTLIGINMARPVQQVDVAATGAISSPTTTTSVSATSTSTPPPPPVPSAEGTYVGHTSAASTSIAIATKAGKAVAYVCDGKRTELWLQGTSSGDALSLQAANGQLTGSIKDGKATGTVRIGTQNLTFTVPVVKRPAGLYRANSAAAGVTTRISWIVQADGTEVGLLTRGTDQQPAPQLDPAAGSVVVDGSQVAATPLAGDEQTG
jgi:hypothetical protein